MRKKNFTMEEKRRWLAIQGYKHDGQLHRYWEHNYLLEENDDFFIVASTRTKVVEADGRYWYTRESAITFFSKKEWWNTIAMIKDDGISFYTNIASPSIMDKGYIKYIDYDLDVKLFADGTMRLLDEKEYRRHRNQYAYGKDLDFVLRNQTNLIIKKMKEKQFPFIDEVVENYYCEFKQLQKLK